VLEKEEREKQVEREVRRCVDKLIAKVEQDAKPERREAQVERASRRRAALALPPPASMTERDSSTRGRNGHVVIRPGLPNAGVGWLSAASFEQRKRVDEIAPPMPADAKWDFFDAGAELHRLRDEWATGFVGLFIGAMREEEEREEKEREAKAKA
jgi:hypothetical protein